MDDNQTPNTNNEQPKRSGNCSFCGRPRGAFKEIVENPNGSVGICNDCIRICREILDAEWPVQIRVLSWLVEDWL